MAAKDLPPRSGVPWYARWQAVVLGLGALAAAILSILALWDRVSESDEEDFAEITSVVLLREVSLRTFVRQDFPGPDVRLKKAEAWSHDVSIDTSFVELISDSRDVAASMSPSIEPVTSTSPQATPTPTPSADTSITPSTSESVTGVEPRWPPDDNYLGSVVDAPVLRDYELRPEDLLALPITRPEGANPNDPTGGELTPREAARELASALKSVVVTRVDRDHKSPRGYVVGVNVRLSGLKDVPLLLQWSLDGIGVTSSWRAKNVAYRLTATTEHDGGSVNVWVPKLKKRGTYHLNLSLTHERSGVLLHQATPLALPPRS